MERDKKKHKRLGERERDVQRERDRGKETENEKEMEKVHTKTCTGLFHAEFIIINSQSGNNPHVHRQMNE